MKADGAIRIPALSDADATLDMRIMAQVGADPDLDAIISAMLLQSPDGLIVCHMLLTFAI